MKKFSLFLPFMILTSCQWIVSHPEEDLMAIEAAEKGLQQLYEYETKTLSPAPPMNQTIWHKDGPVFPPFKIKE